jgi:phospholipid transport system substrate-binding protein
MTRGRFQFPGREIGRNNSDHRFYRASRFEETYLNRQPTRFCLLLITLVTCALARADAPGPEELVKRLTSEVLDAIGKDKDLQAGDKRKALALAEEKVLPYIDFRKMTQLAVGKSWRRASAAQQDALTHEFRSMLVRTYTNSIGSYGGQKLVVDPLRFAPEDTDVTVKNQFLSPGKPPLPLDYRMRKAADGWKAYDIIVDGVSLVMTYRSSFSEEIQRSGIDGLIKKLGERNLRGDERENSKR